jgi:hypothetical protein
VIQILKTWTIVDWLMFMGGLGTLITVIAGQLVNIIIALKGQTASADRAGTQLAATKEIAGQAAVIAGHVNSAATKSLETITAQARELESMRVQLSDAEKRAVALALATKTEAK